MFNFFKKKLSPAEELLKKFKERKSIIVGENEKFFFNKIFSLLPTQYNYLLKQNQADIVDTKAANLFNPDGFDLAVDESKEQEFVDHNLPSFFTLKGIFIKKKNFDIFFELKIGITNGVFIYYSLSCEIDQLDINEIDLKMLQEELPLEDPNKDLVKLIGSKMFKEIEKKYNISNIYVTDVKGKKYIVFSVDDEGNIYCVDYDKKFYFMQHDPWLITPLDILSSYPDRRVAHMPCFNAVTKLK